MTGARWQRLQELFHAALERPADERRRFMREACGDDEGLLADALELLSVPGGDEGKLQGAIGDVARAVVDQDELSGRRIGSWRIVREIGHGGMGRVFLAERDDDSFEQQVAIKLLRAGNLSPQAIAMFASERQTLARLSHPNVAMLLDGGTTDGGTPFVVMQYVDGPRLDEFAARGELDLAARLKLFIKVCAGVSHAHRNLVVHRDIKPSNVLVDAEGEPKLLDFGIAKILGEQSADLTKAGIMTPAYASPEQVEGKPVTVQTDVYALGALLFELLTGEPPFRLDDSSPAEAAVAICSTMPPLPSATAGRAGRTGVRAALLRGDLDNIVHKAMRKEPERRYDSVQALVDDIVAFLGERPVSARPDSWRYRGRKFLSRNAALMSVASAGILLLVALVAFYTMRLQGERDRALLAELQATKAAAFARGEAETARRVSDFVVGLFDVSDPRAGARKDISARELLDEGSRQIDEQLDSEPGIKASLMRVMGLAYGHMGYYDQGIRLLEGSLENTRIDPDSGPLAEAEALNRLAEMLRQQGDNERSSDLHREALSIREALATEPTWGLGDSYNNFGLLQYSMGRYDEALAMLEKAIDTHSRAVDSKETSVGISLHNLALVQRQLGQYELADATMLRSLRTFENAGQRDKATYSVGLVHYGRIKIARADFDSAQRALDEARQIADKVYNPDNPRLGALHAQTGAMKCGRGEFAAALEHFDEGIAIYTKSHGERSWNHAFMLRHKADCLLAAGSAAEAEALLRASVAMRNELFSPRHVLVGIAEVSLAHALLDQQRAEGVTDLLTGALSKLRSSFAESHPHVLRARFGLARAAAQTGSAVEAGSTLDALLRGLEVDSPLPVVLDGLVYASDAAALRGDCDAAVEFRRQARQVQQSYAPGYPATARLGLPAACEERRDVASRIAGGGR